PSLHEIHNGADDNASGTAAVLELADVLSRGRPLSRSVIFVCFTAEESGLVGSAHFVSHPPIELSNVAAMLNLDMVGRLRNEALYVGGTGTTAGLEDVVKDADAKLPLQLKS